jgi:2-polyprenyl-3-methyl-5-hydroxy-6-metoxy-1,4-benzoquinol methylase
MRNIARFPALDLGEEHIFRCRLTLPTQAPPVVFGIRIAGTGDRTLLERHVRVAPGGVREWGVELAGTEGACNLELWTELDAGAADNRYGWARFVEPRLLSVAERWAVDDERSRLAAELDQKYSEADPWKYQGTRDDEFRRARLLAALPARRYERTLDIGCGDGYVTFELPGREVVGTDLSLRATALASERAAAREDAGRFRFEALDVFQVTPQRVGRFDLVVVTGVLYPQYIGSAWSAVRRLLDDVLKPGGLLAMCHIQEWTRQPLPYARVYQSWYPYRGYTHVLEVFAK